MGIFGWDLPPGCSQSDIDRAFGEDGPCEVCGGDPEKDCICLECPVCGTYGDPDCYDNHGLLRSIEQVEQKARKDKEWDEYYKQEAADWERYAEEENNQ